MVSRTISMGYQPLCASSPRNPSLRLKHSPCMPFKKPATSASCLSQSPLQFIIHSCRFIRLSAASTGRPFQLHLRLIHDPINAGLSKRLTSVKASLTGQNFVWIVMSLFSFWTILWKPGNKVEITKLHISNQYSNAVVLTSNAEIEMVGRKIDWK